MSAGSQDDRWCIRNRNRQAVNIAESFSSPFDRSWFYSLHRIIYITDPDDPLVEKVEAAATGRLAVESTRPQAPLPDLSSFDAVLLGDCKLSEPLTSTGANGPKFLQLTRGHHRSTDMLSLNDDGVIVAGTSPVLARQVAEYALGLAVIALSGNTPQDLVDNQAIYQVLERSSQVLSGKTLGVVGFGRTGQATANLAASHGTNVIYADVRTAQHGSTDGSKARRSTLDLLLSKSDVVSLHVQWGPTSNPLISHRELRLMQRGAVLVNTADARLIDHEDLRTALENGKIRVGFDIEEPAAAKFREAPNAIVTPYLATRSEQADTDVAEFVVANTENALGGSEPDGVIEMIDFPKAGDPAFWSSRMSPRTN